MFVTEAALILMTYFYNHPGRFILASVLEKDVIFVLVLPRGLSKIPDQIILALTVLLTFGKLYFKQDFWYKPIPPPAKGLLTVAMT